MISLARREFVAGLLAAPLFPVSRGLNRSVTVEAEGASTFFAPYVADTLEPGQPLAAVRKGNRTYLAVGDLLVGRLPDALDFRGDHLSITLAELRRDDDDRLRMFVALTRHRAHPQDQAAGHRGVRHRQAWGPDQPTR